MQYTGSSFAELLVARFSWVIRPRFAARPRLDGPFPAGGHLETEVPDAVLDLGLLPLAAGTRGSPRTPASST